ncbi:MAG: trypsin-like peptidase domain-containing protein, partial [Thaumarchaeota archaeon]|nr:trypsin-like peptidase domain-containing protein [Nitrososphaerota archaeon]
MQKSGVIVGSILGATIVLLALTFVFIPPPTISPPQIIVTNGHGPSTVGEETPLPVTKDLSLIQIFERTEEGVVQVNVHRTSDVIGANGIGSGFVFDKNGHIITNEHVVQNSDIITVTFLDGRSYNAEVVGVDAATDIAVIKVNADPSLLKPIHIGDSSNLKVGMPVAAIGNPFGLS